MNPDKLTHFSAAELREPAVKVLNVLQDAQPEHQLLALATTLAALSDGLGVNPHDLLTRIDRAKRHIDAPFANQYRAIVAYAQGELKR